MYRKANGTKIVSVMTSCMILSCPSDSTVYPIRLAGTCSRYSNSAMPQLASAATHQARPCMLRRCAYQAKVMKRFDAASSKAATSAGCCSRLAGMRVRRAKKKRHYRRCTRRQNALMPASRALCGQRQVYADDDAVPAVTIGRADPAAVKSGNQANDIKPQPEMRLFAFLLAADRHHRVEQALVHAGRKRRTLVLHAKADAVVVPLERDDDRRSRDAELDRVGDQLVEQLGDQVGRPVDRQRTGRELEHERVAGVRGAIAIDAPCDH